MKLTDFKALTFDCYGTLIDWETGIINALNPLVSRLAIKPGRDEILQAHANHESAQQALTPDMKYSDLLAIIFRRLGDQWNIDVSDEQCTIYGNSVKDWPAFIDSVKSLEYLQDYYKLIILSNVDTESFKASNARLQIEFDAIFTAQDIGSYKPSDNNFSHMLRELDILGIEKSDILHTAESMFHDHEPANRHGLASCWIYRRHNKQGFGATMIPDQMPHYDFRFNSMAEFVSAHRTALITQRR